MRELSYTNGLNAQNDLAIRIAKIKKQDPFRHVTLIVDSNHQALQFRRQLVRSLARVGESTSLVAFSAMTKIDVLTTLARIAQMEWDAQAYKASKQAVLRNVLISHGEVFGNLAKHPESFATLSNYVDQFDWIDLNEGIVQELRAQGESLATKVSLDLLEVAKDVQEQLRVAGKLSPVNVIRLLANSPSERLLRQAKASLGQVFVVSSEYPTTLSDLIDGLLGPDSQEEILLRRGRSRGSNTAVFSFPDPETEAKAVVRQIAERISEGGPLEHFAVLYTDAKQYADILESELDQAQITWNGIATELAILSLPATATKGYLAVVNSIFQSGTFTRADLLSLLRTSSVTSSGEKVSSGTLVRFLSRNGLFNEVSNWAPLLQAMVDQIPNIEKLIKELAEYDAEQDEINDAQSDLKLAQTADILLRLIRDLMSSADRLSRASNGLDLSIQIWQEVNEFFPQLENLKLPIDRISFDKLAELFTSQQFGLLASRDQIRDAIDQIGQTVLLKLGQLRMQHGELARGVYVGPVTQNGALYFENLWIVGAGEGMLPQEVSEDPILPDVLKDLLNQKSRAALKTVAARVAEIESNFFAVATGAQSLTISYPRGGTLAKSEGMPSSWLPLLTDVKAQSISSGLEYRLLSTGAVSLSDLDSKEQAAMADEQTWSKELASAVWFVSPEASAFAGNFEGMVSGPLIDFENKPLSASSVEKFLKCGHNFFTTKVLGISDMDEADSIDELRSIDFGKAVHAAFERLLKEHPELSPSYGESYSQSAKEKFQYLFLEECDLIVARGQSGWPPLFESRKQTFLNLLDDYFAFELQARTQVCYLDSRGNSALKKMNDASLLKPQFAEFEFDKTGDGLLEVEIQPEGFPKQTLKFKGLIDRVDISADREHVGVLDFKTGSKGYIDPKTAVQDLLYEYAIRHNSNFVGVKKVSSRYLFLSKKLEDSGLKDLRSNRNLGVFLDPSEGGLQGHEYVLALSQNQLSAESELIDRLTPLVVASNRGAFLTHDVIRSKNSFKLCPTCKKLGQNTIATLSLTAHVAAPTPLEAGEEGAE